MTKGEFSQLDALQDVEFSSTYDPQAESKGLYVVAICDTVAGQSEERLRIPVFEDQFNQLKAVSDFEGKSTSFESTRILDCNSTISLVGVGDLTEQNSAASAIEAFYFQGNAVGKNVLSYKACEHLVVKFCCEEASVDMMCAFLNRLLFTLLQAKARINVPTNALYSTGKPSSKKDWNIKKISVIIDQLEDSTISAMCNTARTLAEASTAIALVVNCPANILECQFFAELVQKEAQKCAESVTCKVFDEKQCAEMSMGALTAVASGSKFGCRLVHLTYKGRLEDGQTERRKICLVGKGITMDTGGYNLKTNDSIVNMKIDMAGAATMLFTALAIARLEIPGVEVHAVAPMCENMIDRDAYRPGDFVKASNGKTIEITNTDAEGRLILADALVYAETAIGGPGAGVIIDAATLTGAALISLGLEVAAVMSNRDDLSAKILKSASCAGEAMWALPLRRRYFKKTEGPHTDLMNSSFGSRYAGTMIAGLFLQQFVSEKTDWAHIDLAGPVWDFEARSATGYGVASLINFVAGRHST